RLPRLRAPVLAPRRRRFPRAGCAASTARRRTPVGSAAVASGRARVRRYGSNQRHRDGRRRGTGAAHAAPVPAAGALDAPSLRGLRARPAVWGLRGGPAGQRERRDGALGTEAEMLTRVRGAGISVVGVSVG